MEQEWVSKSTQRRLAMCSIRGRNPPGLWISAALACGRREFRRMELRRVQRSSTSLLRPIDLRLLERVGVIHIDRLPLGVKVNRADAALAMAVARCLRAAEREVNFGADGRSVDVGDAGFEISDCGKGLVHVLRVQRRR